jgi:G:T-mismatch repair DNA endonuclease (very short patch repair protein)
MSILAKRKFIDYPNIKEKMYTEERNKKISLAKEKYWKEHPENKIRVGNMWKSEKEKDEVKWRKRLLDASKKGFEKIYAPNGETSLETKLYNFLSDNNIKYEKQYELDGKLFDAYLVEYNILLEFDGEFWHKLSLEECMYDFQKESFYNDQIKNSIAKKHNITLYRIRENDTPTIILVILSKHFKCI